MLPPASPFPTARQVSLWALCLHQHGIRETAGLRLEWSEVDAYPPPSSWTLRIFRLGEEHQVYQLFVASCRADGTGPVRCDAYVHGAWTADLHLETILAYDNLDEGD